MRKILAGFVVALAIGIPAIYFGVPWWAEQKALRELDGHPRNAAAHRRGCKPRIFHLRLVDAVAQGLPDLSIRSKDAAKGFPEGRTV